MATVGIPPYAAGHHQPLGGGGGSGGGGGGGSFSPLTMFECTISSATMLIDNMAVRDLLVAFKIVAQLHGHLLEVLDPTVQRLANVADEHALCPPPVTQSMSVASHLPGTSVGSAAVTIGNVGNSSSNSSTSKKLLDSSLATTAGPTAAAASSTLIKPEIIDSDDDCVLMEADLIFDQHSQSQQLYQQQQHQQASFSGGRGAGGAGGSGGGADSSASGELSNEWKGILRKAYRVLKDETGTNVFDFSLPYSARANVLAANRVIDKALELSRHKPANVEAWRTLAVKYFRYYYAKNLKYPFRNVVKNVDTQRFIRRLMVCNFSPAGHLMAFFLRFSES
ncbi:hypothetical protein BOX15_Mlig028318g1 [Macrostomum lignano]|uniref:Uncharacterized protein n=1 Tax=Macrostomum lignano TaxID=282301 RepID=A0A267HBB9_9PLAT|nr:hypothetical protein BOX15_Mlig028318g1 [Macrostomum lignano]